MRYLQMPHPLRRIGAWIAVSAVALCAPAHAEVQITYTGLPVSIPDNQPEGINVGLTVAGLQAIVDLDVRLSGTPPCDGSMGSTTAAIVHPYVGDLVITLTSPQGTTITLMDRRGGTRDNVCNLSFDDDGGHPPVSAATSLQGSPLLGSFAPEQALSAFDGENPNGVWTLNISDTAALDEGTFRSFSLVLDTTPIDIVVDVFDDPTPATCAPGSCSLREAVQLANAQAGPNRILLPAGSFELTRAGANENANSTGDLDISDDLIIAGAGATSTTLTQTTPDRVLQVIAQGIDLTLLDLHVSGGSGVADGGALSMSGSGRLWIEGGSFSGHRATRHGGAIYHTGGSLGSAGPRVVLRDCHFEDNRATNTDATNAYGGALYSLSSGFNDGFLQIENCSFIDNRADNGGGALGLDGVQSVSGNRGTIVASTFSQNLVSLAGPGGAIGINVEALGLFYLDIHDAVFEQNSASTGGATGIGGALSIYSGGATVRGTRLIGNSAHTGGAIGGDLSVMETSTVCENSAVVEGGGVRLGGAAASITRSTFCNNVVSTSDVAQFGGGAIAKPSGDLSLERNTLDGNVAVRGAGISFGGNDLSLRNNTIVAPSPLPAGAQGSVLRYTNVDVADALFLFNNILIGQCSWSSSINPGSAFSNLEASGNTCRLLTATLQGGNQVAISGSSINLAVLADNGGPTTTRLPQVPSVAIDAGNPIACSLLDQRGFQRNDAQCDIGAVEAGGTLPPVQLFADGFE